MQGEALRPSKRLGKGEAITFTYRASRTRRRLLQRCICEKTIGGTARALDADGNTLVSWYIKPEYLFVNTCRCA